MTDDNAEREKRKQFLKDQLRTRRIFRQHLESVRGPEWLADPQLRWEAEQELEQEEAEAAAKARQQEPAAPPGIDPPSPEPELREAPEAEIRKAVLDVYERTPLGAGPNLNEVIPLVEQLLKTRGLKTSGRRIREIAEEESFLKYRRKPGTHRS